MPKIIALSGIVGWDILAEDIRADLKAANGEDIIFEVNSPGGFVHEGIEIFNLIRSHEGNTEAKIVGLAASMMSYIVLAANKVTAMDNATFLIHNAMTCTCGNHNDMRKAADWLEGLSSMIAKAYVNKTGKSAEDIKGLMDAETFLFGDEILTEGFVDEIIPALDDGETDKAAATLTARASVEMCKNKMRTSEAANEDFNKAVAYVDSIALLGGAQKTTDDIKVETPAVAGKKKQEDKHMTFAELLAENPSAKAEYDVLVGKARTEGRAEAKDEMKAVIASISPKLMSEAYGQDVKEAGIKAITGEGHMSTFETLVVIADRDTEAAKAELAKKETEAAEETPGAAGEKLTEAEAKAAWDKKKKDILDQGGQ